VPRLHTVVRGKPFAVLSLMFHTEIFNLGWWCRCTLYSSHLRRNDKALGLVCVTTRFGPDGKTAPGNLNILDEGHIKFV